MSMFKHIKDPGPVGFTNVFGAEIDDKNRTRDEYEDWLLVLRSSADTKALALAKPWKQRAMTFTEFVQTRLLDQRFGKDLVGLMMATEIQGALRDMAKTGWLTLAATHWEVLRDSVQKPEGVQYNTFISMCLVPFCKAVVGAVDELPPDAVRAGTNGEARA